MVPKGFTALLLVLSLSDAARGAMSRGKGDLPECPVLDCTDLTREQIGERLLEVSRNSKLPLLLTGVSRFWRHEHWKNKDTMEIMTESPERWKYPVESHDGGMGQLSRGAHTHNHEQTFLALRTGQKRWYIVDDPPKETNLRLSEEALIETEKVACTTVQYKDEVIFLPHWIYHATYNSGEPTVGVSSFDTQTTPVDEIPLISWLEGGGPYQVALSELLKPAAEGGMYGAIHASPEEL